MREQDAAESKPVTIKTVAIIVAICGAIFGPTSVLIGAYFSLATRVTVLEQQRIFDSKVTEKLERQLECMNGKLDKILENRH